MPAILKYLKGRYIDSRLDEKAQGMVEYAVLIAGVICLAAYLIYGDNHGQAIERSFDNASETLEAVDRNNGNR